MAWPISCYKLDINLPDVFGLEKKNTSVASTYSFEGNVHTGGGWVCVCTRSAQGRHCEGKPYVVASIIGDNVLLKSCIDTSIKGTDPKLSLYQCAYFAKHASKLFTLSIK